MGIVSRGYALVAYASFLLTSIWAGIFLTGPVDGAARHPATTALAIDSGLLLLFAAQHSVMARAGFKRLLDDRSTYVLASSLALAALYWWWQPVPAVIWSTGAWPWALYAAGWVLVVASTFMVDHAEFLGLRAERRDAALAERWLYRWVRHPMMLGLIVVFWAAPRMTVGHLFFAVAGTGYILVGIRFEERDLRRRFGTAYADYARRVPALLPLPRIPSAWARASVRIRPKRSSSSRS
ncbi:isoprenylcysteine carboxylmethyltransferase family protein [Actinoplanes sp. NPDC051851]|uniref:methyltransferase family protein n=1 Tax=Actinoplanes sp. NPDC051851 TaxID=3154753 RepID=UPI00342C1D60